VEENVSAERTEIRDATDRSRSSPSAAVHRWQRTLFEKLMRFVALIALPVIALGSFYVFRQGQAALLILYGIGYTVIVAGAFARRVPYRWRVWGVLGVLLAFGISDLLVFGWAEDARVYLMTFVLLGTIFLGRRAGLATLVSATLILLVFVLLVFTGTYVPVRRQVTFDDRTTLLSGWAIFTLLTGMLYASFNYLFPRLFQAMQSSSEASASLETERATLLERTRALQESNRALQRRSMYLEASLQVAKSLAAFFELEPLLDQACRLVTRYFDFYHAGIFLMDETGEWAVLRAASSTGGRRMLAQGHRLRRGSDSMVGWVVENRQPRIAADVGEDTVYFANPDLPATHSAMTLPLIAEDRLIGVLDVQSTDPAAFDRDDIRSLQGLAEQLAVTIANARRLTDEAAVLEAASPFYRLARQLATARSDEDIYAAVLATLREFEPTRALLLRVADGPGSAFVGAEMRRGEIIAVENVATSDLALFNDITTFAFTLSAPLLIDDVTTYAATDPELARLTARLIERAGVVGLALVPIRVTSGLLGVLVVSYGTAHRFTTLERRIYDLLADLGAVALERTQLLQVAQTRLEREQWIREFGERVMRIPDLKAMMAQAAQSLQEAVQADGVVVALTAEGDGGATE
jgi:GAF domain-containing protein